jgi:hypothetical protein
MNLHLATLPDDPVELARWLESMVAGLDLPELVAELGVLFPPDGNAPKLGELLGRHAHAVLERGLAALPEDRLRALLEHPNRLYDLQLYVLGEGSPYWLTVGDKTALGQRAAAGKLRTCVEDDDVRPTAAPPRRSSALRWATMSSLATAAAVLVGVWFARPFLGGQPAGGWGWNESGILAEAKTPAEHFNRLADGADAWFNKQPRSAVELGARLAEMRRGCSQLILGDHPPLNDEQRGWLVGKCKEWAVKLDQQLAALERGAPLADVQKASDEVVRKLSAALRDKANDVG